MPWYKWRGTAQSQERDNPLWTTLPLICLRRRIFLDDLASCGNSSTSCGICKSSQQTRPISGNLLAIGFAATMQLLSNYFDLLFLWQLTDVLLIYPNLPLTDSIFFVLQNVRDVIGVNLFVYINNCIVIVVYLQQL